MVHQHYLKNGMKVVYEYMEYVHSVSFGVWVQAGSKDETKKNNGMAHMIEHMMFKGTKKRSAKDIADETADIGGNLNAYTSKEFTSYYGRVLTEHLPKALELVGDMLKNSVFLEEELEKEKNIVMEEIDMYKDSPEDAVHEMLQKEVWKDHALGYLISGEREQVEKFTREDVISFVNEFYTADHMLISVAGNFDENELLKYLEELFGDFPAYGKEKSISIPIFHPCIYMEEKDIEQVHLNLAFSSISALSEERYAFSVLNAILGGGANSRLFLKIREELGLAYSIYSYGSTFFDAGLFHIYAAVNPSQAAVVLEEIEKEILYLMKSGPEEAELRRAKEQIKTDLIIQEENIQGHMERNARSILSFQRIISVEEILQCVNQVTKEDILFCMEHYFDREKMGVGIVGNLQEMDDSSREYLKKLCKNQ